MGSSDPTEDPIIIQFLEWRMSARQMGIGHGNPHDKQPFLPNTSIEEYFREPNQIERLLRALYPNSPQLPDAGTIRSQLVRVFCILLCIGKGTMIRHFTRHASLNDRHLPFEARSNSFPTIPGEPDFFNEFKECQWEFCPTEFKYVEDRELGSREILPITSVEEIGGGGSAIVYKVVLHEAYNQLLPDSDDQTNSNGEEDHTFVLKTYNTPDAHEYYTNEVSAFKGLRDCSTMIGFLGSFRWNGTYNILLEYADQGTLEDYFKKSRPPKSGKDIHTFWERILCIGDALMAIHNDGGEVLKGPQIFQGWHQDVKPANILVKSRKSSSNYDLDFKLADLGTSHFKKKVTSSTEATDRATRGTRTYGPPECYRTKNYEEGKLQVRQNVDIWSMACVLSETALWMVHDYESLKEYRDQRRWATDTLGRFQDGDCFHNGKQVLPTVADAHRQCVANKRDGDYITAPLLEFVDKFMLVEAKKRCSAHFFCAHAEGIIGKAKEKLDSHLNPTPTTFFGESSSGGKSRILSQRRAQTPPEVPPEFLKPEQSRSHHEKPPRVFDPPTNREHNAPGRSLLYGSPTTTSGLPLEDNQWPRGANHNQFGKASQVQYNLPQGYNEQIVPVPRMQDRHDRGTYPPLMNGSPAYRGSAPTPYQNYHGLTHSLSGNLQHRITKSVDDTPVLREHDLRAEPTFHHLQSPGTRVTAEDNWDTTDPQWNSHPSQNKFLPSRPGRPPDEENSIQPVQQQVSERVPYLSVEDALNWKARVKKNKNVSLPHGELFQALQDRDSIFLIDDASSMRQHWDEVKKHLELLAWIAKKYDPDGLEVYFAMSRQPNKPKRFKTAKALVKELTGRLLQGRSDMRQKLGGHLQVYIKKIEEQRPITSKYWNRSKARLRPLNIFVFTDGVWQPHCDVEPMIRLMVKSLQKHELLNAQVGIQFIRFGDNEEGRKRLVHLDCGITSKPEEDIVDVEDSNGNVFKMLLGAINPWFDSANETDDPPASTQSTTVNQGNFER